MWILDDDKDIMARAVEGEDSMAEAVEDIMAGAVKGEDSMAGAVIGKIKIQIKWT